MPLPTKRVAASLVAVALTALVAVLGVVHLRSSSLGSSFGVGIGGEQAALAGQDARTQEVLARLCHRLRSPHPSRVCRPHRPRLSIAAFHR